MNFLKTLILLFFITSPAFAASRVAILNWNENIDLNSTGRNSEISILGRVSDLPKEKILNSFSISFGTQPNIKITKVLCDNFPATFTFNANTLTVKFPKGKVNNENIMLNFTYEMAYPKINKFLRQELIDIPPFAAGANSKVIIKYSGYFESATLNPNITKNGNSYIYSNIVPKNGVAEIIKLTPAQVAWDVNLKLKINGNKSMEKIIVKMPVYFQSPRQKVENYNSFSRPIPIQQFSENNSKNLTFETKATEILIENKAHILTGEIYRNRIAKNPAEFANVTNEERSLLAPMLERIKQDPTNNNLPFYAKIGKFAHQYIRYDLNYLGKLPNLNAIVQSRSGVCTEYAKLYDALLRLAGIPSIIIDGAACGEYDQCRGHSWNMIFVDGKWIEVDPTWNLMSGIVSSSHIYFNDHGKGETMLQYYNNDMALDSSTEIEMKTDL
jgi:hypothetical protein